KYLQLHKYLISSKKKSKSKLFWTGLYNVMLTIKYDPISIEFSINKVYTELVKCNFSTSEVLDYIIDLSKLGILNFDQTFIYIIPDDFVKLKEMLSSFILKAGDQQIEKNDVFTFLV